MTPNSLPLEARLLVSAPDTSAGRFMYMPAGRHVITPSCQGKPVTVVVDVKPVEAAAALNRQLDAVRRTSAPQRPYFDFNHEKDRASFWPERFEAGGDGVYVIGEFSASGKAAVEGKDYRAFSPLFYTDAEIPLQALRSAPSLTIAPGKLGSAEAPAQVICFESAGLNFGGLVNEPAFRAMQPLFAKSAEAAGAPSEVENQTNTDTMKKTIAELQAANAALDTKVKALAAKADKTEIETAQLAAHQAEQRATALELEAAQRRADDAKAHVAAAVADGRIPAQNTELQAKWTQQLTDDASALVLLAALPKSPLAAKAAPLVGITRESSLAVLNAFAAEADPKKRAALYAREIKARLKEGDPLPLEGANSLGTLAGTLVTQRVLELLKFQFPMLNRVSTDFSDVQSRKGQAVVSRIVGIPTVVDYDPANGWVDQDASTTDVTVTLNKQRGVPHTFTADVLASTVRRLFDEVAAAQSYALAKDMVDALYAVITSGNYSNATTQAQNGFARSTVIGMGVALNKRGVPQGAQNRTLLLNSDYFGTLASDSAIVTLAAYQKPEIIEAGTLPDVHGFSVVDAPNLPTTGNLTGFGFSKSALLIVARPDSDYTNILPGASYGNVQQVTDPDLGLTVTQVQYVNHQLATATQRISLLYGVAKGQVAAGQRLVSA